MTTTVRINVTARIRRARRISDRGGDREATAEGIDLAACLGPDAREEAPDPAQEVRHHHRLGSSHRMGAPIPGAGGNPRGGQENGEQEEDGLAAKRGTAHGGSLESAPDAATMTGRAALRKKCTR